MNDSILLTFASHPITDFAAMFFSVLYIFLACKGNIWCWLAGFISTFFYIFIFINLKIDSQVILNVIYMILSVVGWMLWLRPKERGQLSLFVYWPMQQHIQFFIGLLFAALCLCFILPSWFSNSYTYIEAWLFCASLLAAVLTMYRVIECWLYWVVIDLISLGIYWQTDDNMILLLYLTSLILAVYGYLNWSTFRKQDIQQAVEKEGKKVVA